MHITNKSNITGISADDDSVVRTNQQERKRRKKNPPNAMPSRLEEDVQKHIADDSFHRLLHESKLTHHKNNNYK